MASTTSVTSFSNVSATVIRQVRMRSAPAMGKQWASHGLVRTVRLPWLPWPQRFDPLQRVTLNLLWVTAVWEHPDELITGRDHLVLRDPGPGAVVGFAQAMIELKAGVANVDHQLVSIRGVGLQHRIRQEGSCRGPGQAGCCPTELAQIDDAVVPRRVAVAGEPGGDLVMTNSSWPRSWAPVAKAPEPPT